jgi:hypothetical protein
MARGRQARLMAEKQEPDDTLTMVVVDDDEPNRVLARDTLEFIAKRVEVNLRTLVAEVLADLEVAAEARKEQIWIEDGAPGASFCIRMAP